MDVPRLSVVIPAYNAARYITEAVSSVLRQVNAPAFETIVVDDGSSDETAAIVARDFPSARLIRKSNGGPGSARNRGVEEARAEVVVFLDADDVMLPGRLDFQGGYMLRHADVGLSFGNRLHEDVPSLDLMRQYRVCDGEEFSLVERPFARLMALGNFVAPSTSAVRRDLYLSHARQPENILVGEDYSMALDLARHTRFAASCRFLSWYRAGDGSNLMSSEQAYYGPLIVSGTSLRDHGDLLTSDERLLAQKRMARLANALLRFAWVEKGAPGVARRLEEFDWLISSRVALKWRVLSRTPRSIGYVLRELRRTGRAIYNRHIGAGPILGRSPHK